MQSLPKRDLYAELESLPPSVTGEIVGSQLYAHPRPGGKHILVSSVFGSELLGPYQLGRGGPGGWWILQEPEVHLTLDLEVVVPDIAGWRRERLPDIPDDQKFTVVPDWVCEISSPSTTSYDWEVKKPLYARYGVKYLWLIDPRTLVLKAFKLVDGNWEEQGVFAATDTICLEPFDAVSLSMHELLS